MLFHFSGNEDPLFNKIRILVWVMTMPKNLETKAAAVKETWGKHSNVILFFRYVFIDFFCMYVHIAQF